MEQDKTASQDIKTVGDLYDALDWSYADVQAAKAAQINPDLPLEPQDLRAVRLEMIDKALGWCDHPKAIEMAQLYLNEMKVWEQIQAYIASDG